VESKWQFDYWPLKLKKHGSNDLWWKHVTQLWKDFDENYKIVYMVTCLKKTYFEEIMKFQIFETQCVQILKFHFRILEKFSHFNVTSINITKYIIRGEIVILPKFGMYEFIWIQNKFITQFGSKCTNHLLFLVCAFLHVHEFNLKSSCYSHLKAFTYCLFYPLNGWN